MRIRLTAATDVATFIIFDPGAIQADEIDLKKPVQTIDVLTARGKAIFYSAASDGEADFLVLIGEEPDPEFVARRRNGIDALLRVPSGRIVARGYEDLCGSRSYGSKGFEPHMGDANVIPRGDYSVKAFEVDWGEVVEQKIAAAAAPGDRAFENCLGISMGCVIFATVLLLPALLAIVWEQVGFNAALKGAGFALVFHVAFWSITVPTVMYSKRWGRMMALRKDIESQHPSVVLVFRPLIGAEKQRAFSIGKFGDGFAK